MTREKAAAEITRQLVEHYHPERVYLFGSTARGDYGPDSDLDICAVFPDDAPEEIFRRRDFRKIHSVEYPKQIVPWRSRDFDARAARIVASLPASIVREGKLLYGSEELLMDEVRLWLKKAHGDLRSARGLIQLGEFDTALFHCEQAAGKAIKGFLAFHQQRFRKTHELDELGEQCVAIDGSLENMAKQAEELEKYGVEFRYPDAPYDPDAAEAQAGLEKAEFVVREIEQRLPNL